MTKTTLRCYTAFAKVLPRVYNVPVYYLASEGFSSYLLATCKNCGELFAVNMENPKTSGLSLPQIAGSKLCPKCNSTLRTTIAEYPQTVRLPDGRIGGFIPDAYIPPGNESIFLDLWEIAPE